MKFVRLTENNDHEGESWNFWLQLDGNEVELQELKKFLSENGFEDEFQYELDLTEVDESEVDILVKHSKSGYMSYENKVVGKFKMFPIERKEYYDSDDWKWELGNDTLYKGGIESLFHA